ncbi:thioredoxin family protein [Nonlabens agnitus]|uniref:Thiol reductase thioredoxin n=1 Tax=Nonlabens agnitus TaxID=870484 RepID=A0A2S9WXJ1_9FLAO|nr:thioredoxin family protein [Nonlabens agnitus]PRP68171.1 thiol reductase thioredoxin [Nonlabens agnitus]
MRKILPAAIAAILLTACGSQKEATTTSTSEAKTVATVEMTKPEAQMATMVNGNLQGVASLKDFQSEPFSSWFTPRYEDYTPDAAVVSELKSEMKDVSIRAYMGTWCGDSKRETPKFFKLLDAVGYDQNNLTMVTVDRSKREPADLVNGYDISRVPTFIFYRDGEELGRFVEYPRETLEQDILKIVSGQDYKHSYQN